MATQTKEQQESIARLLTERDTYKEDTNELLASKKKVEFDAKLAAGALKQKNEKLDKDLRRKTELADTLQDEVAAREKQNRALLSERDKQKLRITKLISRKGKFDSGLKTCKNCSKEYNEKEDKRGSGRRRRCEQQQKRRRARK